MVLKDDGFQLPTPLAKRAVRTAEMLLEWLSDTANELPSTAFASSFVDSLNTCFQPFTVKTVRSGREKMWENYYKLRSSDNFKTKWTTFLNDSVGSVACPIFYQYVTDCIMEVLIKQYFPVDTTSEPDVASLTYEEANALRYTAGYVIRALRKKIEGSAHPLLEELVLCLVDMEEKEGTGHESEDWTNLIDRGALKHISDSTYMLFLCIELELRKHLRDGCASEKSGVREKAVESILENEDMLFYWSLVSVDWEEEESKVLLKKIVEHWVTLRGFSFTGAFLEMYKRNNKKSVQKSKGLRKKLQTE